MLTRPMSEALRPIEPPEGATLGQLVAAYALQHLRSRAREIGASVTWGQAFGFRLGASAVWPSFFAPLPPSLAGFVVLRKRAKGHRINALDPYVGSFRRDRTKA